MQQQVTYLHLHVPKNAGNTFNFVLRQNFGDAFYPYYGLMDFHHFTADDVKCMIESHRQYCAYSTHMMSLDLPRDSDCSRIQTIAFVRPPAEWLFSYYCFHKNNTGFNFDEGLSFDEFVLKHSSRNSEKYINGQMRFLTRNCDVGSNPLAFVKSAVSSGRLVLLPSDRFDDSLIHLEQTFPDDFRDCSYPNRANVSNKRKESTDCSLNISKLCSEDVALHMLAVEGLDAATYDRLETKQGFMKRCASRRRWEAVKSKVRSMLNRVSQLTK